MISRDEMFFLGRECVLVVATLSQDNLLGNRRDLLDVGWHNIVGVGSCSGDSVDERGNIDRG